MRTRWEVEGVYNVFLSVVNTEEDRDDDENLETTCVMYDSEYEYYHHPPK